MHALREAHACVHCYDLRCLQCPLYLRHLTAPHLPPVPPTGIMFFVLCFLACTGLSPQLLTVQTLGPFAGAMFFVLCFFAFTSLTTVDLFQMERKMVIREVRGEPSSPRPNTAAVGGAALSWSIRSEGLAAYLQLHPHPVCGQRERARHWAGRKRLNLLVCHQPRCLPRAARRILSPRHLPAG